MQSATKIGGLASYSAEVHLEEGEQIVCKSQKCFVVGALF
jgi:hypothetical protein